MKYQTDMLYKVLIDEVDPQQWLQYAGMFSDYSIYQTWAYQEIRAKTDKQQLSRIVIKDKDNDIVLISHVRIKQIMPLGLKIGYMQMGPLMLNRDGTSRCRVEALKILRQEYLKTRVDVLRIVPNIFKNNENQRFIEMLEMSGFQRCPYFAPYHTLILPLGCSSETLRKGLHQKWRKKLRKAEKAGVEIVEKSDNDAFELLDNFYYKLCQRKKFKCEKTEIFSKSQSALSDSEKMSPVVVCLNGEPVAVHLTSNLGDTAIALLVAASDQGYSCWSSYLAWWKALTISNERGMKKYDFGGIDFEKNPSVSRFKAGMGGEEQFHIGAFDAFKSSVTRNAFRIGEKIYKGIRNFDR